MNYLDFVILFFLLIGFILGFKDGLIRKIIGLIGFIASIGLAIEFYSEVGLFISPIFSDDLYISNIFAGILIFIMAMLSVALLKRIIHPLDKVNRFMNQLLGGFSGTLQMIFFISGFLLFLNIFEYPGKPTKNDSLLYGSTYQAIPFVMDIFIGSDAKAKRIILNFIEDKEEINLPVDNK